MKKILLYLLLLCSISTFAQAEFPEGIQVTNVQDNTALKVNVQAGTGVINWRNIADFQKEKAYLSTGLLKNGAISINADPTKNDISAGIGIISNFDDPENPTSVIVNFPAIIGHTPAYLTMGSITYQAINSSGALVESATPFTNIQKRDLIILGAVIHSNLSTINAVNNISAPSNAVGNQLHDFIEAVGALNLTGNKYTSNGANLQLNKSAGTIFKLGVNFANDWKNPHVLGQTSGIVLTFRYRTQNGTEGSDRINLDPALYDLNNVLTSVPNNKFTIQTVVMFQSGLTRILYGQNVYDDLATAKNAVFTRNFVVEPNSKENGIIRAYIIMKNSTTSLQNVADADILEAQKFGGVASGGIALTLANIVSALGYTPANDIDVLHKTGNETKTGNLNINGLLSINQAIPESTFHIGDGNAIILDRYKNGSPVAPNFLGRAYNGTKASPTTILDNQDIAIFGAIPYNGIDAEIIKGWLKFIANGNQSGTNRGTKVDISITPLNATTPSKSVFNADNERILISDAGVVNSSPVAVGYFGKGEITGENPHKFQVVSDGLNPTVSMGNFGGATAGNAGGHLWSSRGTATSPTAIQSGDYLWSWGFRGQGTTTLAPSSANISVRATENFSDTAQGTEVVIGTNETGHNANLGRTSEFKFGADGVFSSESMQVQSYSAGKLGSIRFGYHSPVASRSWRLANDYDTFGDFAILQSTTQTGSTYSKKLYISDIGDVTISQKLKANCPIYANDAAADSDATLLSGQFYKLTGSRVVYQKP